MARPTPAPLSGSAEPVDSGVDVPFTSFSQFNWSEGGDIWFALGEDRPLAVLAGGWTRWTSVRRIKEGEITADLFGFLPSEIETWLAAPAAEALQLQRPLPDGALTIVARGTQADQKYVISETIARSAKDIYTHEN